MGIVDATPIGHTMRKPGTNYSKKIALDQMNALLAVHSHLPIAEASRVLEAYA
jgi:hypothetical protein